MDQKLSTSTHDLVASAILVGRHLESELEEVLAGDRLTLQSFFVLSALARAPQRRLTQKQLVSAAGRTSGTTSVRLNRLQRAGLIERSRADDDARVVDVRLTDAGAELQQRAQATYDQAVTQLTAALGDAGSELETGLRRWLEFFAPAQPVARRLGVVVAPAAVADRMRRAVGLPAAGGLLVVEVEPDSPAAAAGLDQGDLIQTLDGEPIHSTGDLERALERADRRAGAGVLRGADAREVEVTF
jgi:DNA-binding MarR family transcriptional regulator